MTRIAIAPNVEINDQEFVESFVRAPGPGGQNVNKVATAVQLRFDAVASRSLPEDVRERLVKLAGRKMTRKGVLVIVATRFRTQERNRADARARLVALIARAAEPLPPPRRKTRPSKAVREKRLADKRLRGQRKRERRLPED